MFKYSCFASLDEEISALLTSLSLISKNASLIVFKIRKYFNGFFESKLHQ
jgi:hypothetical protein